MDAFSFSLALGLIGIHNNTALRLAFIVAVFHVFYAFVRAMGRTKIRTLFGDVAIGIGALYSLMAWHQDDCGGNSGEEEKKQHSHLKGMGIYALAGSVQSRCT
jgi:putative Mn2+ efflux pump MntP